MTRGEMAAGLVRLGVAYRTEVTEPLIALYFDRIGPRLDGAQWEAVVNRYIDSGDRFFPTISQLLAMAVPGVPAARAVEDYQAIVWSYEGGRGMAYREILDGLGRAAAEGFAAAGAHGAFAWCEPSGEPFRRKAFVEAWVAAAREDPVNALPAAPERKALRS